MNQKKKMRTKRAIAKEIRILNFKFFFYLDLNIYKRSWFIITCIQFYNIITFFSWCIMEEMKSVHIKEEYHDILRDLAHDKKTNIRKELNDLLARYLLDEK